MRAITNKVGYFLVSNTVWIFLTAIVFVSFIRIMLVSDGMVYLSIEKWQLFGQFIGSHSLLFSPILLYSFFRKKLQKNLPSSIARLLWLYCFLGHSFLVFHFNLDQLLSSLKAQVDTPVIFGLTLLLVEIIIQLNEFFLQKLRLNERLQKLKMEKAIIAFVILVAFTFSFPPFNHTIVGHGNIIHYIGEIFIDFLKWLLLFFTIYLFYRINHYLLIEKVFKIKGIFYYLFAFGGLAMIFTPIFAIIIKNYLVAEQEWWLTASEWIPKGERSNKFKVYPAQMVWNWMYLSIPIILVYQWWKQKSDITQLEKEKSNAELNTLKQQVNPHFLFNTLNSLYALSIEENGEKTADGIAKLGTLMRYNLHDAQVDKIALSKEIDYIKKYIELQELRLTDKNKVSIQIDEIGMDKKTIAPMLLIPFIENAFKYGVSPSEDTKIDLKISLKKDTLVLQLLNTIIKNRQQKNGNGIGISNTRQRLAKLYPKKYELIVEETAEEFEVYLDINIGYDD